MVPGVALLVLLLVSGEGTAIVVDRALCLATVEAVRSGQRVTLEDDAGALHEVEMARCALGEDDDASEVPTS